MLLSCTKFILFFYLIVLNHIYSGNARPMCFLDVYYSEWKVDINLRECLRVKPYHAENKDYDRTFLTKRKYTSTAVHIKSTLILFLHDWNNL